jgi:hypothetical protein
MQTAPLSLIATSMALPEQISQFSFADNLSG